MAERHGIVDDEEVERILEGTSEVKLSVPQHLRVLLQSIGLGVMLAPLNIMMTREPEQILVSEGAWQDIEFEVALDSARLLA